MTTPKEMELIVKLAITEADLKFTEGLAEINQKIAAIPEMVAKKIRECQGYQDRRRRWNIGTLISTASALTALAVAIAAHWR